jgi:hypothetical protein
MVIQKIQLYGLCLVLAGAIPIKTDKIYGTQNCIQRALKSKFELFGRWRNHKLLYKHGKKNLHVST